MVRDTYQHTYIQCCAAVRRVPLLDSEASVFDSQPRLEMGPVDSVKCKKQKCYIAELMLICLEVKWLLSKAKRAILINDNDDDNNYDNNDDDNNYD